MIVLGYALAVVIGLSLGLLGGGGSILTIPVLVYVLRYDMKEAVPMSLVVVGVTSAVGAVRHHRAGNIRWDAALGFGVAATVGAFLGGRAAALVSSRLQLQIFALLMVAAAVSMYFGPGLWGGPSAPAENRQRSWPLIVLVGGFVGSLTGLFGVGGGFMYVPALVLLAGLPMRPAIGTSLVLIIVSCVSALVSHLGSVELPWQSIAVFTGLGVLGVLAGSALCRHVSQERLRRGFAVLLIVMGVFVFLRPR